MLVKQESRLWQTALAAVVFALVLITALLSVIPLQAGKESTVINGVNCRFGVTQLLNFTDPPGLDFTESKQWISTLGAGWFQNYHAYDVGSETPDDVTFVYMIRVRQDIVNGVRQPTYTFTPPLTDAGLGQVLRDNPGALIIVGNEPDVANSVQDNTMPDVYAHAYHEAYEFIKRADPTAYVAVGALSMATPGRLQYLDIVWDTYLAFYGVPMPVDVWTIHLNILAEKTAAGTDADGKIALGTDPALALLSSGGNPALCPPSHTDVDPHPDVICVAEHDDLDLFIQQLLAFRTWMKEHQQQEKPLILSELTLLYPFDDPDSEACAITDELGNCFTPERVLAFFHAVANWLESSEAIDEELGFPLDGNRLVQQWNWYSLITLPHWSGGASNLLLQNYDDFAAGSEDALTLLGQAFQAFVMSQPTAANLAIGIISGGNGQVDQPGGTATVNLTIHFFNNGTATVSEPFEITLYGDAALTQVLATVVFDPAAENAPVNGCAWNRSTHQITMEVSDLEAGVYSFWAVIDSQNDIVESSETDNVGNGLITIMPTGTNNIFASVVFR